MYRVGLDVMAENPDEVLVLRRLSQERQELEALTEVELKAWIDKRAAELLAMPPPSPPVLETTEFPKALLYAFKAKASEGRIYLGNTGPPSTKACRQ